MGANRRPILIGAAPGGKVAGWGPLILVLAMGLWMNAAPGAMAAQESATQAFAGAGHRGRTAGQVDRSGGTVRSDDWTFRPTVLVRRGGSQGSGTIIASIDGETLVLTAAHVVKERGPITIELHRYNLGLERSTSPPGVWPRPIEASVAATDPAADLAILRIEKIAALPYVARLAPDDREPSSNSLVTSIGIDLGTRLSSWTSRLVEALWFELNDNREERFFLMTAGIPEHGRSGGGLFLANGELVGVCLGHAELSLGQRMGVFASRESIRSLLSDDRLAAVVSLSEVRQAYLNQRRRTKSVHTDETRTPFKPSAASPFTPDQTVGARGR